MKKNSFTILCILLSIISYGQDFYNGSFEKNITNVCRINDITNAEFDSIMYDVRSIGETETMDIIYDLDCSYYDLAQAGNYFVTVENNFTDSTQSTILSLKLTSNMQVGSPYELTFYDRGLGPVVIGVSDTDSTFGSIIYVTPFFNNNWTMRTVNFNAPLTAGYITVKFGGFQGGVYLDNFILNTTTGNDNLEATDFELFPNPAANQINIQTDLNEQAPFKIYNAQGQLVKAGILKNNLSAISINQFPAGLYIFELETNNKLQLQRFIVNR